MKFIENENENENEENIAIFPTFYQNILYLDIDQVINEINLNINELEKRHIMKYLTSFFAIAILFSAFFFIRLSDFDLSGYGQQRIISFQHHQDVLQGTLILPPDKEYPPVVLIVHGDGAQDRWSGDGYIPLVKFLVAQGIAVFSWDKPGIGTSTGNWLAQTMPDRAEEAALALQKLKEQPELKKSRVGYLGFSQAGWVVPHASQLAAPEFVVLAGAAINWRNQGIYFTEQRLKSEGRTAVDIQNAKKLEAETFDRLFTEETASRPCLSRCTRQDFERRNSRADATTYISEMHTPTLIIMGEADRNVDPNETIAFWTRALPVDTPRCIRLVPNATHGLLRSKWFDYQLPSQFPLWKQGIFLLSGQYAYSPGALNAISLWILNQECDY
ncbi:alpha/beta hydrolase family protein [Yersinia intermedia]|uniref:alpha/beta hydrolase family protein n=1 Tax=Yersinia intermedia TaxID=631 RepID=UPI0005DED13B|nr:alpha/beta hydrolase [Yersinia intermedia]MCB5321411.1 alpha/beta hydrolase [Yersinia intermedia]UNK22326.1 alpha/beta hydrolase [Yersinia intermedia]CNB90528.1 Predicted dienelactone hydrolase [Yersinia intermedia]CNI68223.1 Predicted dienelactone hydrolase [Yersinia intermedia]CRE89749.1 Predicted dienelactone hydrolase [Yersinia intermedia]